ncbi:bile acid:sodium symporter family protein [Marinimicrococcus flavescens]|uniref:Bile acid:sodium symporter n=1 Tax=Marinimicrococcus flavescens TaxID=3031815 RepID=A0AAP3UZZ1_9PROT|nr:bile acid:sodium symporter [Marinimicrococcus flavescens]
MSLLSRLRPDNYSLTLLAVIGLASLLPASGDVAIWLDHVTTVAIAVLFFMHGARLSREAVVAGAMHWRLHLVVAASTFVLFPVLGLLIGEATESFLSPGLVAGILFLCALPSTVQSSIAFTSMGGGNVAAAVCSASASNIAGIFITPLLVGILLDTQGVTVSLDAIQAIVLQLLVPFVAGQLARPLIASTMARHKAVLGHLDRGTILLVVYAAFSHAVVTGLWRQLSPATLGLLLLVCAVLLAVVLVATTVASRLLGFSHEDEVAAVFCGSKKTLASGVPMAAVLFPAGMVGLAVLPLMLFHQLQLMVCAAMAHRYAARAENRLRTGEPAAATAGR